MSALGAAQTRPATIIGTVAAAARKSRRSMFGLLVERFRNSNHMLRHSGAPPPGPAFGRPDDRLRGEPESITTGRGLWIPGSPPSVAPRNDQPRYDRSHRIAR